MKLLLTLNKKKIELKQMKFSDLIITKSSEENKIGINILKTKSF